MGDDENMYGPWCIKAVSLMNGLNISKCRCLMSMPIDWAAFASWSWRRNNVYWHWRGQEEERERKFWVIFILAWFDSMVPGPGILNSWLARPRWQLVAASVSSAAWTTTKLSERAREREREWTTARHDIRKESEKVNRQFIAQWSKKRERWKALTWVKLRVIGRKGNRNTKVCWSGRNWTSWKVNNTGWAFEALIFRSEKWMTLAQTMTFFGLPSLWKKYPHY